MGDVLFWPYVQFGNYSAKSSFFFFFDETGKSYFSYPQPTTRGAISTSMEKDMEAVCALQGAKLYMEILLICNSHKIKPGP